MILSLDLNNDSLYGGLDRPILAGKRTLIVVPEEAMSVMSHNLTEMDRVGQIDRDEVVLTGGMAIWAYLMVFHFLHGKTKRIYYQDGRGQKVLVAAHG
jgi:hypothetical protein